MSAPPIVVTRLGANYLEVSPGTLCAVGGDTLHFAAVDEVVAAAFFPHGEIFEGGKPDLVVRLPAGLRVLPGQPRGEYPYAVYCEAGQLRTFAVGGSSPRIIILD